MDIAKTIAENLSDWMEKTPDLNTLKKVEAKSNVGFGTVRRTKNGDGNVTVEKLAMIAEAFKRHPAELMLDKSSAIWHTTGAGKTTPYPLPSTTATPAAEPIPLYQETPRQKREAEIRTLLAEIDDYGLVVILEKCKEIAKTYPAKVQKTEQS